MWENEDPRAKILVVDDDNVMLEIARVQLESEGFAVVTSDSARGGLEAFLLALHERKPFDVMATDLDMPGRRGTDLIRVVREMEEDAGLGEEELLRILLLTGVEISAISGRERNELLALSVSYLAKEHAVEQLVPAIQSMLMH